MRYKKEVERKDLSQIVLESLCTVLLGKSGVIRRETNAIITNATNDIINGILYPRNAVINASPAAPPTVTPIPQT